PAVRAAALGDLDADPVGGEAHGLGEAHALVLLQEAKDVAALLAAEALEDLPLRVDAEGRRLLVVERAARPELAALLSQRHALTDDADDVGALAHELDLLFGNHSR